MATPFDPNSWMDAADKDMTDELAKLDASNAAKGGRIMSMVKGAFEAAKSDDKAPIEAQIASAKALGEKYDAMLRALEGAQPRREEPRRNRDKDKSEPTAPPKPDGSADKEGDHPLRDWFFGKS